MKKQNKVYPFMHKGKSYLVVASTNKEAEQKALKLIKERR